MPPVQQTTRIEEVYYRTSDLDAYRAADLDAYRAADLDAYRADPVPPSPTHAPTTIQPRTTRSRSKPVPGGHLVATPSDNNPAYKPKDAAIYCGCSVDSLIRWGVKRTRVHQSADGLHDRYVYLRSDLNDFLRSQGRPIPKETRRRGRE